MTLLQLSSLSVAGHRMSPHCADISFLGLSSLRHNLFGLGWIPPLDSFELLLGNPVGPGWAQGSLGYRRHFSGLGGN